MIGSKKETMTRLLKNIQKVIKFKVLGPKFNVHFVAGRNVT